ncbi:MAG: hypothetical protein IJ003_02410 [Candidatus Gastranaerophilales bacterium]|nr:hypothetical protein [Candidatus Gastranaerophilales bacterium]
MRINSISNQHFKADYKTASRVTPAQVEEYYQGALFNQRYHINKQISICEQEAKKLQSLQQGYEMLDNARVMTLDLMKYMHRNDVQKTISKLPKHDTVTLHTPAIFSSNCGAMPYLEYESNSKNNSSYMSNIPQCHIDIDDKKFNPQTVDMWLQFLTSFKK